MWPRLSSRGSLEKTTAPGKARPQGRGVCAVWRAAKGKKGFVLRGMRRWNQPTCGRGFEPRSFRYRAWKGAATGRGACRTRALPQSTIRGRGFRAAEFSRCRAWKGAATGKVACAARRAVSESTNPWPRLSSRGVFAEYPRLERRGHWKGGLAAAARFRNEQSWPRLSSRGVLKLLAPGKARPQGKVGLVPRGARRREERFLMRSVLRAGRILGSVAAAFQPRSNFQTP